LLICRWLDAAKVGAEFLRDKCRDKKTGWFYFAVTEKGEPLIQPFSM